jgi:hypothetical protein
MCGRVFRLICRRVLFLLCQVSLKDGTHATAYDAVEVTVAGSTTGSNVRVCCCLFASNSARAVVLVCLCTLFALFGFVLWSCLLTSSPSRSHCQPKPCILNVVLESLGLTSAYSLSLFLASLQCGNVPGGEYGAATSYPPAPGTDPIHRPCPRLRKPVVFRALLFGSLAMVFVFDLDLHPLPCSGQWLSSLLPYLLLHRRLRGSLRVQLRRREHRRQSRRRRQQRRSQ